MSWLTTHVLDTSTGCPAAGVTVACESERSGTFHELARGTTDADGRLKTLFVPAARPTPGVYRLTFETGDYFAARQMQTLYPRVQIVFEVTAGDEHYHIPLLVSPFGFSTYRGS